MSVVGLVVHSQARLAISKQAGTTGSGARAHLRGLAAGDKVSVGTAGRAALDLQLQHQQNDHHNSYYR